jgi:hypothetical protein
VRAAPPRPERFPNAAPRSAAGLPRDHLQADGFPDDPGALSRPGRTEGRVAAQSKIAAGGYPSENAAVADLYLVLNNALTYNAPRMVWKAERFAVSEHACPCLAQDAHVSAWVLVQKVRKRYPYPNTGEGQSSTAAPRASP